ncbi:MAG: L,D-transpeptidase family protein, partial [Thioalkalispiraceae bacterium]
CLQISYADSALLASLDKQLMTIPDRKALLQTALQNLEGRLSEYPADYEASLLKSLVQFKAGNFNAAMEEINRLTQRAPKFHLAHLIRGDMLMARIDAVDQIGRSALLAAIDDKQQQQLQQLRHEASVRLQAHIEKQNGSKIPRQLLLLGENIKNALVVDKRHNRLYVYERTGDTTPPKLVRDFYVSTGKLQGNKNIKGDLRTPEGVYFVTSHIPQEKLPDKYGVGAFPVNYPNELDRKLGKTGYGIWLHGTDSASYSRPPRDSEGCVVMTNTDLSALQSEIKPGVTPVVITEEIDWLDQGQWRAEQLAVIDAINNWRTDWESMDVERYLSHYDESFWSKSHNLQTWKARKRNIIKYKTYQEVDIKKLSLFSYPGLNDSHQEMIVARFQQDYRSNNYSGDMQKRIYLTKRDDRWKIIYEGR